MSAELVIMAAGMGSRFGGLKQAAPIGPNGEMIIDYSVYDAVKAGFDKAIIIIRKDIEADFRAACGKRVEKMIDVEYVYQEINSLCDGFDITPERTKPWGTGHAVLCARDAVKKPFIVINADDYYGQSVYKDMFDYISTNEGMCMAGYQLKNTLSENGTVSRGICTVENGFLTDIEEVTAIAKDNEFADDTIASMNMWGLDVGIFDFLNVEFEKFIKENHKMPKAEFFLPSAINTRMKDMKVKVIPTNEQWYGVTYADDLPFVKDAINKMTLKGLYK